jgi:GTPase SAR1 family protein
MTSPVCEISQPLNSSKGRKTFENVDKWLVDVRSERGDEIVIMIVGNKTDLSEQRFQK